MKKGKPKLQIRNFATTNSQIKKENPANHRHRADRQTQTTGTGKQTSPQKKDTKKRTQKNPAKKPGQKRKISKSL